MSAKWVLLPVLGAPLAHAPVLKWDLLPGLAALPVDGGRTLRGRRLFGANKTVRGAIFMTAGPAVASVALRRSAWYRRRLPAEIEATSPLLVGALLGLGVFTGELPNSFAKRQLDIPPGSQRTDPAGIAITLVDQADFTFMSLALLRPVWKWSGRDAAEIVAVATGVHLVTNVIGYAIGARKSLL
ncbi:MAG TPA: CDP-archaeol synthase [Solirubrobacteraceae bacterium]|nr:CDP-archaeol synthase [Solirubrobacteraceae bacterium]